SQASSSIIIEPDNRGNIGNIIIRSSRPTTPLLPSDIDDDAADERDFRQRELQQRNLQQRDNESQEKLKEQVGEMWEMMIKQGKQIRALYQLLKSMNDKVTFIQGEIKKDTSSTDLSAKVFAVSKIQQF